MTKPQYIVGWVGKIGLTELPVIITFDMICNRTVCERLPHKDLHHTAMEATCVCILLLWYWWLGKVVRVRLLRYPFFQSIREGDVSAPGMGRCEGTDGEGVYSTFVLTFFSLLLKSTMRTLYNGSDGMVQHIGSPTNVTIKIRRAERRDMMSQYSLILYYQIIELWGFGWRSTIYFHLLFGSDVNDDLQLSCSRSE